MFDTQTIRQLEQNDEESIKFSKDLATHPEFQNKPDIRNERPGIDINQVGGYALTGQFSPSQSLMIMPPR